MRHMELSVLLILLIGSGLSGCETLSKIEFPWDEGKRRAEMESQTDEHRRRFIHHQTPEDLTWLLTHRIDNDMTYDEVNKVIGMEGEPITNSQRFKSGGTEYLMTDQAYRWGPDSSGRSIYLFFRNGRLVNFSASDLKPPGIIDEM